MKNTVYEPIINKYKEMNPFKQDKGVDFHNMLMPEMGPKTLSVGLATFEPNEGLPCHEHNVEESVTVLKGKAYCDVEGKRSTVEAYDTSFIPANIPHRFVNASDSEELMILWVYSQIDESNQTVEIERNIVNSDQCMIPKKENK